MHKVSIRPHIVERVMARRGDLHWFDRLDPAKTALLVIDMQNTFCVPGAPGRGAGGARHRARPINRLAAALRSLGVPVIWVLHANTTQDGRSDWEVFFDNVVARRGEASARSRASRRSKQAVWKELDGQPGDVTLVKNRYSAFDRRLLDRWSACCATSASTPC